MYSRLSHAASNRIAVPSVGGLLMETIILPLICHRYLSFCHYRVHASPCIKFLILLPQLSGDGKFGLPEWLHSMADPNKAFVILTITSFKPHSTYLKFPNSCFLLYGLPVIEQLVNWCVKDSSTSKFYNKEAFPPEISKKTYWTLCCCLCLFSTSPLSLLVCAFDCQANIVIFFSLKCSFCSFFQA